MTIPRRVLILGGTGEAVALAARLGSEPGIVAISSLAGRVAQPVLPDGEVRIGGFGGVEGLVEYLKAGRIDVVVDATHPFAVNISTNAAIASKRLALPCIALVRPPWGCAPGDCWHDVEDIPAAAVLAPSLGRRIFLTVGRQELAPFASHAECWFLIRTIDLPSAPLPPKYELLQGRGPFQVAEEIALMREHAIDLVVSKNSGGAATYAKIAAARALGIPVVMVQRPRLPAVEIIESVDAAVSWLAATISKTGALTLG